MDHAYLPCYTIINNIATKAVAGEVVDGPFRSAQATVAESGLQDKVDVRKGNGLAVITPRSRCDYGCRNGRSVNS